MTVESAPAHCIQYNAPSVKLGSPETVHFSTGTSSLPRAILPIPPLARSLYYTTALDHEIPRGLFKAVAQVLAWIMGMNAYKEGKSKVKPRDLDPELPIPEELRF